MPTNHQTKYRILTIFILGLLLIQGLWHVPIKAQAPEDEELSRIQRKIEQNKSKIKLKTREKKMAEEELGEVAQQLKYTEMNLKKAQKNLSVTKEKAQTTEKQMVTTKSHYDSKATQFSKRVREIYKNKNMGALEFIFAPTTMLSIVDSSYYFERLMGSDTSMIQNIKKDYHQLSAETKKLQKQKKTLAELNEEISMKERLLAQKKKQQQRYVQTLHSEITEMERMTRELEASSQEITNKIMRSAHGTEFLGTGRFIKPVSGWLSSLFGYRMHPIFKRRIFHNGLDFAAQAGQPIRAADSGVVIVAGEPAQYRGYGKITVIDHGVGKNGRRMSTVYAHQSRIIVGEGQRVKQGDLIGYVGSTGHATGPHLHFEVRLDGIPVNPQSYLR